MTEALYDNIAAWYDKTISSASPVYDVVLPSLFALLGDIQGQRVCDLACGQGEVTRALARRGAEMVGVDVSAKLLAIAQQEEKTKPLGVTYRLDNAETLATMADSTFQGVLCNLALMDIADLAATCQAVWRVLIPSGWFVFSITHPCFQAPHAAWRTKPDGSMSREIDTYFAEGHWRSNYAAGVRGQVGAHHRTVSTYINTLLETGFSIKQVVEPQATGQTAERKPEYAVVPAFMIVRCQKDT